MYLLQKVKKNIRATISLLEVLMYIHKSNIVHVLFTVETISQLQYKLYKFRISLPFLYSKLKFFLTLVYCKCVYLFLNMLFL
jgi:hypothetical protein